MFVNCLHTFHKKFCGLHEKILSSLPAVVGLLVASAIAANGWAADAGAADPEPWPKVSSLAVQLQTGALAVEDFAVNPSLGIGLSVPVYRDFGARLEFGFARVGEATFERVVSDQGDFLGAGDRYQYRYLSLYRRWLQGRSFLSESRKYDADLLWFAGVGEVEFASERAPSFNLGLSYRLEIRSGLALSLDFRNHVSKRNFLNDDKTVIDSELALGIHFSQSE